MLKHKTDRKTLEILYKSYVRPVLEYGNLLWSNCSIQESNLLENVQLEALRIITGMRRGTPHDKLYLESNIEPLQKRRKTQKLLLMFKIINEQTPKYLYEIIQPHINNTLQYNIRHTNYFKTPLCRTVSYQNSYFPLTMKEWNRINVEIRNSPTVQIFKNNIMKMNNINPSNTTDIFKYSLPRQLNILLTQLRNNVSDLNSDRYNDYLIQDPSCSCGCPCENKDHFFFHCNNYNNIRHHLEDIYQYVGYINTDLITNGDQLLSNIQNKFILDKVLEYISESNRFPRI